MDIRKKTETDIKRRAKVKVERKHKSASSGVQTCPSVNDQPQV